jgi:hypothetical protein
MKIETKVSLMRAREDKKEESPSRSDFGFKFGSVFIFMVYGNQFFTLFTNSSIHP